LFVLVLIFVSPRPISVPSVSVIAMMMVVVMVMVLPALVLSFWLPVILSGRFQEEPAFYRVIHHGFICRLFLLLDGQEWILSDLRRCVPHRIRLLNRHERLFVGRFLKLLVFGTLQESIYTSLAQKISFHLFCRACLAT